MIIVNHQHVAGEESNPDSEWNELDEDNQVTPGKEVVENYLWTE
jgi:hypothetical protein